jgi:hypothetical protein
MLWSLPLFYFISFRKRVALVFRDIIYVINILYSWHLTICEHFWSVYVEQLILGTHAMSTWFWHKNRVWQRLCVFLWKSCYVRWWWDGFRYSSAYCQLHVGVCGYILSCQTVNGAASWGPNSNGAYLILESPWAWLLGARVCDVPGMRIRQTGLIGDKILPTRDYWDRGMESCDYSRV